MKKWLTASLAVIALFILLLSGCNTPGKPYVDSSQVVSTSINQEFTVALGSNPTTGYSWQTTYDNVALTLVNKEYKASDTTGKQIVGSGGTEYFYFKALKSGETKITFAYRRPWESPTPQDQTQIFTIKIK